MADKSIDQLIAAESILATDLFVLQQSGMAKKLPGQVLLNWLTAAADGHGGIQSIEKLKTSGLADTYRITLADTTTFDFVVNNGRGIISIVKISTSGLVDTYQISYNDNTTDTFTVTNGEKGEKGDNAYIWIKYASQEPTVNSHSFGDLPDAWIGVYWGTKSTAPGDWQAYHWYQWKGEKGDKGDPATLLNSNVAYQVGASGIVIPSGSWQSSVPVVPQGKYLWTRTTNTFNTGDPVVFYSVSRMGLDGSGSVSSVANISPDENGNVPLTASDVGALSSAGGDLTGELRMNGHTIKGLNMPTANDQAANMGFVNQQVKKAAPPNLLDNSDWRVKELIVNQRGYTKWTRDAKPETGADATTQYGITNAGAYTVDRWKTFVDIGTINLVSNGIELDATSNAITFGQRLDNAVSSRMFASGKKYTVAIHYTVTTAESNITLFQGLKDSTVKAIGTLNKTVGMHTAVFVFTPNGASGNNTYCPFHLYVQSGNKLILHWAALYEGEYTAETLPEYQPKGYGAELAECQRYYRYYPILIGYAFYTHSIATGINMLGMRISTPTVTCSGVAIPGSTRHMPSSYNGQPGELWLGMAASSGFTTGTYAYIYDLTLDADL